jgi:hypothetical protein
VYGPCVVGLGPVAARARILVHEVLDRGAQAVGRGGARCASQVLDRGAQKVSRGAARSASQVINRGAKTDSRGAAQVLDGGTQTKPTAPIRYLIVVPRP